MKKILLLILDGFGIGNDNIGNAIKKANLPTLNKIMSEYPVSELNASGESVGLSENNAGNCEVGYQTIGCGRKLTEPLKLIDDAIKNKKFFENETLLSLMDFVNDNNSTLHIIGLISSESIHSSIDHYYAISALAKIKKVKNVVFHFITDGRNTGKYEAKDLINNFMKKIASFEIGTVGSLCGRYYALDYEDNVERVNKYYNLLVNGVGNTFNDINRCFDLHKKNDISDEYVNPSSINKSIIHDGDGILYMNFTKNDDFINAFVDSGFNKFQTKVFNDIRFNTLFATNDKAEGAFTREIVLNSFGEYLNGLDFKQARIAETEKFKYVTYYFDGCEKLSSKNIYKIMVPSSKIPDYEVKPQMSTLDVTKVTLDAMDEDIDFILTSFATPDIVASTGNMEATIKGLEICDYCINKILEKAEENFYDVIITSDHGKCEEIYDESGNVNIKNTFNKVPLIVVNKDYKLKSEGNLSDVIPTIIEIYGISKPEDMTGESLIVK